MTKKLEISREQLEKCLRDATTIRFEDDNHVLELRALLAAPVVERQEAPFYISASDWNTLVRDDVEIASVRISRTKRSVFTEPLYASPPAPVAAVLPERLQEIHAFLDGSGTLDGYSFGSFHPSKRKYWWRNELRACLDKVKELNR